MHGIPDAGSTDGSPAAAPPDWPEPDAPLPAEEPTIELPPVTEAMLAEDASTSTPTLAAAALSLALAKPARSRIRIPALERRSPRPARPAAAANTVGLDDLLADRDDTDRDDTGRDQTGWDHNDWEQNAQNRTDWDHNGWDQTDRDQNAQDRTDWDQTGWIGPAEDSAGPAEPTDRAEEPVSGEQPPPPGRRWLVGAGIAAAALLLTGTTVVVLTRGGEPSDAGPAGWSPPIAAAVAPSSHTVTAALDGRTAAGFDLVDGAKRVIVRAADLGDTLYRITTPESGAAVPRVDEQDGRVRLSLGGGAQAVDITLNAAVLWDLRFSGGAELSTIDLSAGRVGGVDLTGGASRIALTLPPPDGTLSVRMSGGVSLFDVRAAGQTPVRVRVGSGAGQVTLNGQNHAGVSAGQTFTPADWGTTVDRIDVDAAAGMTAMTVAPY
ncbi:hypothetical protein DMB66_15260 [Actinoplanes sp. ATCC 53533]|uniref:hypothetical protein n=1 Tax=Actinoplanes sp. ATCC 53533 TaxID=1288362 RepID=UPI000F786A7F|nr:hypothetical protein [Actinoplanes sp. ATCC 53533]RSM67695.1 hypothetical protein DMB66_15260 [Actinoplanes sp. ATCC 53533]